MAFDQYLADRIHQQFNERSIIFEEKKMFGSICFMVNDKMCVGVLRDHLMLRIDPEIESELLEKNGVRPMDFTGRKMKGFLFVDSEAIDEEDQLSFFIEKALAFNPKAKSSKKKK